jgi:hypothetical protein
VRLLINGKFRGRTVIQAASLPGVDTTSMMILEHMNASDVAQLFLWPGIGSPSLYSDSNYQTAFTGFLYEPLHGKRIAWTLMFPESANVSFEGSETYTRVKFTEVRVNEGGAWDAANNSIIIPVSGLYYVYLSGYSNFLQITICLYYIFRSISCSHSCKQDKGNVHSMFISLQGWHGHATNTST